MPIENSEGSLHIQEHAHGLLITDWKPCQFFAAYTPFEVDAIHYHLHDKDDTFTPQPIFDIKNDYHRHCTGDDETCRCEVDYEIV